VSPSPYTTGSPPNRRTLSKLCSLAVPTQRTPISRACCSTLTPTAPDAPCTTTVSPARTPVTCSISAAVVPASSRFAAAGWSSAGGLANTSAAATVTRSAYPPEIRNASTSSPAAPPPEAISVSGPSASITPDTSKPIGQGRTDGSLFGPGANRL
jgi:hypothetical protein